jgi:SAM-dependent methyltransferase
MGIKAPLDLVLCAYCKLLQLKHTVSAEAMYRNYWYHSGTNSSMREALSDIAAKAENLIHLAAGETVLDIGCNDGTLLRAYRTKDIYRVGFDPAQNLASFSREVADKVIVDFFDADTFQGEVDLKTRRPKVITSIAMFYDLEDPRKFVADIKRVMHRDGLWIVQMSYLPLMLKQNEFGNICHEHLEYYSLQSLEYLLKLNDFEVVDAELNDVNGGSLRAYIRNTSADKNNFADPTYRALATHRMHELRERESTLRLDTSEPYREFGFWVERIKEDVVGFISEEVRSGKKVYVYGASTKGNTMLQYFGLDRSLITAAAERNPDKWGRVTVGSQIPIISEQEAREAHPDYFLVLPWHFLQEFAVREKSYLLSGGRFIVPMPNFSLI